LYKKTIHTQSHNGKREKNSQKKKIFVFPHPKQKEMTKFGVKSLLLTNKTNHTHTQQQQQQSVGDMFRVRS
jgi:hypothetical protein